MWLGQEEIVSSTFTPEVLIRFGLFRAAEKFGCPAYSLDPLTSFADSQSLTVKLSWSREAGQPSVRPLPTLPPVSPSPAPLPLPRKNHSSPPTSSPPQSATTPPSSPCTALPLATTAYPSPPTISPFSRPLGSRSRAISLPSPTRLALPRHQRHGRAKLKTGSSGVASSPGQ